MTDLKCFGRFDPRLRYKKRRAAYAVILTDPCSVIAIKVRDKYWLPGGGSRDGEAADATVLREVREELGRDVRLIEEIGKAIQYFHASEENCSYEMEATFFRAELVAGRKEPAEHEFSYLRLSSVTTAFFHQCHEWAIEQVTTGATRFP